MWPKTLWPTLYWAQVPIKCKKTNAKILVEYPFQLPHEWIGKYMQDDRAVLRAQPAKGSKVHNVMVKQRLRLSASHPMEGWMTEPCLPLGFHGDGVPVQGTMRQESLDFLTLNMPCSKDNKDLRVPFTVLQTAFHFEYETKAAILNILLWSLDCLKQGRYPTCRHDGSPWGPKDKARSGLQGRLPAKGILCEIRGDWDWLNSWLNFPTWNTGSGMCWMCHAKHSDFKDFGPNDRRAGLDKAIFVQRIEALGKELCPFWSWPEFFPAEMCLPDWLHAVDQGIGADIAGQILLELAKAKPERTLKLQVATLWEEIRHLYKEYDVPYTLATLSPGALNVGKKTAKVPTLKGLAAQVRHLIPLLPILTSKYFDGSGDHKSAVHKLAKFLAQTYACMEANQTEALPKYAQKVGSQYMALEREAQRADPGTKHWHIMPKLHMFQHICEAGYPPKDYWCYRDETVGGSLADLFVRRGGKNSPATNAENCLLRFQQETLFPHIPLD